MGMRITRLVDATPFAPEGHSGVGPVRLQSGEQVNRSHLPASMLVIRPASR